MTSPKPDTRLEIADPVPPDSPGAREIGFADTGAMWRAKYDMAPDAFAIAGDVGERAEQPWSDRQRKQRRDARQRRAAHGRGALQKIPACRHRRSLPFIIEA